MQNRFGDAINKAKQSTQKYNQILTGVLGIPLNGQQVVEVPNRNSYVYVQLRNNPNEVIQAFNDQVAPSYQLPVVVQYVGNRYIVIGRDTMRYADWQSFSPYLPRHGESHSFDPEGGGGGDLVFVYPRQMIPSLIIPSGTLGASNVIINPYTIRNPADGTWKYVGNTGTQNLTVWNPTGSNAVMVLVCLDTTTGNPSYIIGSGSYFSNGITGTSVIPPYIPTLTDDAMTTKIPLSAIRLISGTSAIGWDNIYDVRQWIRPISSGTVSPAENSLFLSISGSDIGSNYYRLSTSPFTANPESYIATSITSTSGTLVATFASDINIPNLTYLNEGAYWIDINAYKSAGTQDIQIFWQLYKRTGSTETLISTSALSSLISTSENEYEIEAFVPLQALNATDRLVVRIWAKQVGVGSTPTLQIGTEDLTFSRLVMPNFIVGTTTGLSNVAIQDEGILKGNVTGFNFRGTNVVATVSGTWADIFVTGSSGGGNTYINSPLGIYAEDEGHPLGTGTTINFRGTSVTASISGTNIDVFVTGSPFPNPVFGVMGQDEGIPLGTGTTINFVGGGVNASISGSVLKINIPLGIPSGTIQIFNTGTFVGSANQLDFQYPFSAGFTGTRAYPSLNGSLLAFEDVSSQANGSNTHFNISGTIQLATDRLYYNGLRQQRTTHYTVDSDGGGFTTLFTPTTGDVLEIEYGNIGVQPPFVPTVVAGLGLLGKNNGVSLGTGTSLNVAGSRLSMSLSGTTLTLTNSPDPTEQIGIYAQNRGLGIATGTRINTNDPNLVISVSGAVINLATNITIPSGTSAPLPNHADLWGDDFLITGTSSGGLTLTIPSPACYWGSYVNNAGTSGDSVTCDFYIAAGAYNVTVLQYKISNNGKWDAYMDGNLLQSGLDFYAASNQNGIIQLTNVVIVPYDGKHIFKLKNNGKNASSTGYQIGLIKVVFTPSASY